MEKYIASDKLKKCLSEKGFQKSWIDLSLNMINDLKREHFVKLTKTGFTLYAVKLEGKGERLFANFYLNKKDKLEVRFLYHAEYKHSHVSVLEEWKEGKLRYLTNQFKTENSLGYNKAIKELMYHAYDVIHECRHGEIKEAYKVKRKSN